MIVQYGIKTDKMGVIKILNRQQLKDYRILRGLTTRDVAFYCELSQPMITQIETGERNVTDYNHEQFVAGINNAYAAKKNGTFEKAPNVNKPKEKMNKPIKRAKKDGTSK